MFKFSSNQNLASFKKKFQTTLINVREQLGKTVANSTS